MLVLTLCDVLLIFISSKYQSYVPVESGADSCFDGVYTQYKHLTTQSISQISNCSSSTRKFEQLKNTSLQTSRQNYMKNSSDGIVNMYIYKDMNSEVNYFQINNKNVSQNLMLTNLHQEVKRKCCLKRKIKKSRNAFITPRLINSLATETLYVIFIILIIVFIGLKKFVRKNLKVCYHYKTQLQNRTNSYTIKDMIAVLDAIGMGIVATDTQFVITFMNSTAGHMCGCCPEFAVGKIVENIIPFPYNNTHTSDINQPYDTPHGKDAISNDCTQLISGDGRCIDIKHSLSQIIVDGKVIGSVMLLLDVTASNKIMRELRYNASHDSLTGLPNRANFEQTLQNAINYSAMRKTEHALVFLDLDQFKAVNDSAGHAAGDLLLKEIAQLLKRHLRYSDFIARIGGDEFGIILYNCELELARTLMECLIKQIKAYHFHYEGEVKYVGASAGITRVCARGSIKNLIAEADEAYYTAKRKGKGQVCLYKKRE